VDEKGEQLGIMPTREALRLADERGLDLVEVAPTASPPVCRLMDYGKFKYETTRKEREARKTTRAKASNEMREIRLKTRIGEHDRSAKTRQVVRLLEDGARVKVSVIFRGREIDHPEIGMGLLRMVAKDVGESAVLERPPAFEGRMLTMLLSPNPARASKPADSQPQEELNGAKTQDA
jgi:translation initiation factor IF-3